MSENVTTGYYPFFRQREGGLGRLRGSVDRGLRRALDVLAAVAGLLLLWPVFLVIAAMIRRDSPGPVFYRGPRVGLNGREFKILKFRTMYERPESYAGQRVTASGDRRITPVGQWLRDTKLNELPQLWNVLVGDMSLVGPRPEDPELAKEWPRELAAEMLSVRPGVTSPASILYKDEEKLLSGSSLMEDYLGKILPSKLRLDLLYVRNRTFLTDLDIIFLTGVALLPVVRRKTIPGTMLYFGPLNLFVTRVLNWFAVDWVIALLATWAAGLVWRTFGPLNIGLRESFAASLLTALLFSLINAAFGLNRISWSKARASTAFDLVVSAAFSGICMVFLGRAGMFPLRFPAGMVALSSAFAACGFVAVRYRERLLTGLMSRWLEASRAARAIGERVLIVGAGELGEFASWFFTRNEFARTFNVMGYVDDDPHLDNMVVAGKTVFGPTSEIPEIVRKHDIGVVVFAITCIDEEQRERILRLCAETGARVAMFPDLMAIIKQSLKEETTPGSRAKQSLFTATEQKKVQETLRWLRQLDDLEELIDCGKTDEARAMISQMRQTSAVRE